MPDGNKLLSARENALIELYGPGSPPQAGTLYFYDYSPYEYLPSDPVDQSDLADARLHFWQYRNGITSPEPSSSDPEDEPKDAPDTTDATEEEQDAPQTPEKLYRQIPPNPPGIRASPKRLAWELMREKWPDGKLPPGKSEKAITIILDKLL